MNTAVPELGYVFVTSGLSPEPCCVCGREFFNRGWYAEVPGGKIICGKCVTDLTMGVQKMPKRRLMLLGPYNRENLLAALARITGDGRCPGCGEILTEADYVRGSCHACGMAIKEAQA